MRTQPDRILATHVGSLVRPPRLIEHLRKIEAGENYDAAAYEACLTDSIDEVVRQARRHGCWAVHPGYGFLSERSAFASALEDAGITLVGPSAAVMEQMGRKDAAREIAVAAGVPVLLLPQAARARDATVAATAIFIT